MKYLKYFGEVSAYEAFKNGRDWILPNVSYIEETKTVSYNPYVLFNIDNYLTIEALEDGLTASLSGRACEYCIDGDNNWKILAAGKKTESINSGQTLSFRSDSTFDYDEYDEYNVDEYNVDEYNVDEYNVEILSRGVSRGIGTFTISKKCNLKGNCMSMLFGDNAANNYSLKGNDYAFYRLFDGCSNIINVSSNFLPATTLANSCYSSMFSSCKSLTTAPELPATTLADGCYLTMFWGCTSLTTAPELPATTLANSCYLAMFYDCSNLKTAPELPATTLANSCYSSMFSYCTSLTTAPELPATTLANSCYSSMFSSCKSLTTAPELPATTLAEYCYENMFEWCSKLNYIKMLATDIPTNYCLSCWVYNISDTGTFVKHPDMTTLERGYDGIPEGWTVVDAA